MQGREDAEARDERSGRTLVDVVVVGAGAAGLAAASAAAQLGRKVVLLEKNAAPGGSTALSVGSVTATCTPHQIARGIQDSPEHHFEDLQLFSGAELHRDNLALARVLTRESPEMFRWLLSTGLEFVGPFPEPPHRQLRMHNVLPNSKAFPYVLGRHCRRLGVDMRVRTRAESLIRRDGRIVGVRASLADGTRHEFLAKGGVILAGGDFSASVELKARYASEAVAHVDAVNPTSTGDGIRMAVDCGAVVLNGDHMRGPGMRFVPPPRAGWLQRLPPVKPVTRLMRWGFEHLPQRLLRPVLMRFLTTSLAPSHGLFREGAILVDRDGLRFTDETQARDPLSAVVAQRRDATAFLVFDESLARRCNAWPNFISSAPSIGYAYLDDYRRTRADIFHAAPTPGALAASIGVSAAALERTIAEYNSGNPSAPATPRGERPALATPPYYALGPAIANIIYTDGGVKVNGHAQVLTATGEVIAGLYAVGSNGQGGLLLKGHGHHLGWAFVSGRLAGRHAALAATEAATRGGEQ